MTASSRGRVVTLLFAMAILGILAGFGATRLEPVWFIAGVAAAITVSFVFYDYRVGVVCLTFLLPWSNSDYIPQTYGFSLINFLIAASLASFAIQKIFRNKTLVWLPSVVVWCYLVPIACAVFVAWPYLPQGSANFPTYLTGLDDLFTPVAYLKGMLIKPMLIVIYAFLIANLVRDSRRPELLFIALGLSAIIPALAIIGEFMAGGDVMKREQFLAGLGLHVNEYGLLLALAAGPLLFMWVGGGPKLARFASGGAFCIVSIGLMLTASRGAAVAYIVIIGVWLLRRRRIADLVLGVVLAVALLFLLPAQVQDRLTLGIADAGQRSHGASDDVLTMGRLFVWEQLAPDFWLSPFWGRGLGSTAWNTAVTSGRCVVGHPHNVYLAILLDVGIIGFAAIIYLYYRYGRAFFRLSNELSLSPIVRDYISGAFASFLGMLASTVAGGHYRPAPEQTFLWFSLGVAFSYWHLAQKPAKTGSHKLFGAFRRQVPLNRAESMSQR